MDKELSYELLFEILKEKNDPIKLTKNEFKEVKFNLKGYPTLIIELFCFLTNTERKLML